MIAGFNLNAFALLPSARSVRRLEEFRCPCSLRERISDLEFYPFRIETWTFESEKGTELLASNFHLFSFSRKGSIARRGKRKPEKRNLKKKKTPPSKTVPKKRSFSTSTSAASPPAASSWASTARPSPRRSRTSALCARERRASAPRGASRLRTRGRASTASSPSKNFLIFLCRCREIEIDREK